MLKSNKFNSWQAVSQAIIPSVCLPLCLERWALPHNPNILTFTSLSISKKSNFAGTTIRARGVMTNGVGIAQKWGSVTFVVICEKRRYQDSLFSKTILGNYNKGSLPHRKVNFFASFCDKFCNFQRKIVNMSQFFPMANE